MLIEIVNDIISDVVLCKPELCSGSEAGDIMEEKRKSKRMDLDCKLVLKRLDQAEAGAAQEVSIHVLDVSKTGVGFECPEKLSIGGVYECYLTIWTKETIHSFIQVVRALKKETYNFYGGIFIGMSETDINRINIYSEFSEVNFNEK